MRRGPGGRASTCRGHRLTFAEPPERAWDRTTTTETAPGRRPWTRYLEGFLRLLFPAAHSAVDWSRGWEALDAELQQVVRDAAIGRRLADKLFRVWLANGDEAWVLIHVEVQGQVDDTLPERAFVYHYRIFDKYERPVATLIVLADERPDWRPGPFRQELLGCRTTLEYPTAKLLDWSDRLAELEADPNPFAVVVLAHLASLRTRKDPTARLDWKWPSTSAGTTGRRSSSCIGSSTGCSDFPQS